MPNPLSLPVPIVEPDIPIVIRKSTRSTRNPSPHYNVSSYHRLFQLFYTCLSSISFVSIPKSVGDALAHPGWRRATLDEMNVLQNNGTWDLVYLLGNLWLVACGSLLLKLS